MSISASRPTHRPPSTTGRCRTPAESITRRASINAMPGPTATTRLVITVVITGSAETRCWSSVRDLLTVLMPFRPWPSLPTGSAEGPWDPGRWTHSRAVDRGDDHGRGPGLGRPGMCASAGGGRESRTMRVFGDIGRVTEPLMGCRRVHHDGRVVSRFPLSGRRHRSRGDRVEGPCRLASCRGRLVYHPFCCGGRRALAAPRCSW
jgi:hypothetical protein